MARLFNDVNYVSVKLRTHQKTTKENCLGGKTFNFKLLLNLESSIYCLNCCYNIIMYRYLFNSITRINTCTAAQIGYRHVLLTPPVNRIRYLTRSWSRIIHLLSSQSLSPKFIIIFFSNPLLGLPSGRFQKDFISKTVYFIPYPSTANTLV
jgi:hypothetical protein